ncbi:MAG: hypothetical protein IJD83_02885 [Clostridia bacterium]|nr:hypothetical protein [Clostridia bacterium]
MSSKDLVLEIYKAVADADLDKNPFSQCAPQRKKLDAIMESMLEKDHERYCEIESAQNDLICATQIDAFCVGFRTAAQLLFQLIGREIKNEIN